MVKKINGVEVGFLGWSAKADGTGTEAGFYQPGDVITPTESISLYAMWDTTTQYTATVNTYLDGVLTDAARQRLANSSIECLLTSDSVPMAYGDRVDTVSIAPLFAQAIANTKTDPATYLLAVKYIETLRDITSGQNNKTVYMPYEASSVLSSIGSIKDIFKDIPAEDFVDNSTST